MNVFRIQGLHKCSGDAPSEGVDDHIWAAPALTGSGTVYLYLADEDYKVRPQSEYAFGWISDTMQPCLSRPQWVELVWWWDDKKECYIPYARFNACGLGNAIISLKPDEQAKAENWALKHSSSKYDYNAGEPTPRKFKSTAPNLQTIPKETNMSKISQVTETAVRLNKAAATNAAFLEGGRIANQRLSKLIAPKLPMMARGYADSFAGRLVLANIAQQVVLANRPQNSALMQLTSSMVTAAYSELIATIDIDGFIDGFLADPKIAGLLAKAATE